MRDRWRSPVFTNNWWQDRVAYQAKALANEWARKNEELREEVLTLSRQLHSANDRGNMALALLREANEEIRLLRRQLEETEEQALRRYLQRSATPPAAGERKMDL